MGCPIWILSGNFQPRHDSLSITRFKHTFKRLYLATSATNFYDVHLYFFPALVYSWRSGFLFHKNVHLWFDIQWSNKDVTFFYLFLVMASIGAAFMVLSPQASHNSNGGGGVSSLAPQRRLNMEGSPVGLSWVKDTSLLGLVAFSVSLFENIYFQTQWNSHPTLQICLLQ